MCIKCTKCGGREISFVVMNMVNSVEVFCKKCGFIGLKMDVQQTVNQYTGKENIIIK